MADPERRGATFGGPRGATYGTDHGATYGSQRPRTYRAILTTRDGRRLDITATVSVSLKLEHTAVSDVELTVPRMSGLDSYQLANLALYYGDSLLFSATVEKVPSYGSGSTGVLAGRGPARVLERGSVSVDYSGWVAHEAIRDFWETDTPFDATVLAPSASTSIPSDADPYEGSPMAVLQTLHELAGMRFTVQHTAPDLQVESYEVGTLVREGTWTATEWGSTGDYVDYANVVEVLGGVKSDGSRASATAKDQDEIDRIGFETEPWLVRRPDLTTDAECQALADSTLAERADANQFSGSISIIPQLVLPGYAYEIPEFDDAVVPIERVSIEESFGEATASLELNPAESNTERIARLQRETNRITRLL